LRIKATTSSVGDEGHHEHHQVEASLVGAVDGPRNADGGARRAPMVPNITAAG